MKISRKEKQFKDKGNKEAEKWKKKLKKQIFLKNE